MAYRNTLQADALKLVAKKLQSSLAVEGELPEDGLAAFGDEGDDLMLALARQIVSGEEETDSESLEAVFAQARDAEASAEEFLVDDDWKAVDAEPETASVNGNGHHSNGNGHGDGIEAAVELVLGNGHHANTDANGNGANGDGHHSLPRTGYGEEPAPAEGQQSLFSWAEFLAEEPVKPRGRNGRAKPAAASLFDWALEKEAGTG